MTEQQGLTLDRVRELLEAVDEHLRDGPPITLLVGGGVAMMTVVPGRVSVDVDVLNRTIHDDLAAAVAVVAEQQSLTADWLNNDAARFVPALNRTPRSVLFEGTRLAVEIVSLDVLLAMKILAGRERDMEDTIVLMERTGITTEETLAALVEESFGDMPHLAPDLDWALGNVRNACEEYSLRQLMNPDPASRGGESPL